MAAAAGALALAGCSNPSIDPVDWWHSLEGGPLAETRPPPPNADAPYPNLGQVPPKPAPLDPARRNAISAGLVADRANAQYTASLSPLQVMPPNALAAPPPLPKSAADADQNPNATLEAANAPPPARIAPLGPPQPPLPNTTPNPPRPAPVGNVTAAPLPPLVAQPASPPASANDAAQVSATPPAPAAPSASGPTASEAPPASSPSGPAVPLASAQTTPPRPAPTPLAPSSPATTASTTAATNTTAAAGARPPAPPRPAPPRATAPTAVAAATPPAAPAAPPAPVPPPAPGQATSALLPGMPEQPPPMVQLSGTALPTRVAPTPAPTPPIPPPTPVAAPQPGAPVTIAFTPGSAVLPVTALAPLKMLVQRHGAAAIAVTGYGEAASADPATLPAALQLALARARSIAANLLAAGVPSSSIRIATQARGNGGAAQIVSN